MPSAAIATEISVWQLIPQAIAENWTIKRLSAEAGCGDRLSHRILSSVRDAIETTTEQEILSVTGEGTDILKRRALTDLKVIKDLATVEHLTRDQRIALNDSMSRVRSIMGMTKMVLDEQDKAEKRAIASPL